jgi:hypothetical protein
MDTYILDLMEVPRVYFEYQLQTEYKLIHSCLLCRSHNG